MALPTEGMVYDVEWKNYSVVASVMERQQIKQFCEGLTQEVMEPVAGEMRKMKTMQFWLGCLCCLLLTCGMILFRYIVGSQNKKKAAEVHARVVKYCHDNREPFYAVGIRPRPGTGGCYIEFVAD
jgi:hypothetical protein